jgi:hypothetical protein
MLPVHHSPAAGAGDRVERVSPFGMQLERGRFASVAERKAPSEAERPPQAHRSGRTAAPARTSLAPRGHKSGPNSEAMHFCRRPGSAILYLSGHAIGPKGVRRRGDHSPV